MPISLVHLSQGTANEAPARMPAILPAAQIADELADHLAPSWARAGNVDVVSRYAAEEALRLLDRLFRIEAQRYAAFAEGVEDDDLGCNIAAAAVDAIYDLFASRERALINSYANLGDQAVAWQLKGGLKPIEWEPGVAATRDLVIAPRGGKLPVAYLSGAWTRAAVRLSKILQDKAGLSAQEALDATNAIRRSVLIEAIRAGLIAGENLETLASLTVRLETIDADFIVQLIARGASLFILALLSSASAIPEKELRDAVWEEGHQRLEDAAQIMRLPQGFGSFIAAALSESRRLGSVTRADEVASFTVQMIEWLQDLTANPDCDPELVDAVLKINEWEDWEPDDIGETTQEAAGEIVVLAEFRAR